MLKGDMFFNRADSEGSFFMGEEAERGIIVAYPSNTGVLPPALDDVDNVAIVPTGTSEIPIGILMDTVVNIDLTRFATFESRREAYLNADGIAKVEIIRKGWFVTDQIDTGLTPSPGDAAYFTTGGLFTTSSGSAQVGRFESEQDADGFARIRIDL